MNTTTCSAAFRPADVDESAYARFVANETRKAQRMIARGQLDAGTDARQFAEALCVMYRHHFRNLVAKA